MVNTKIIHLEFDETFYQSIVTRAKNKGFHTFSEYVKDLFEKDIKVNVKSLHKFDRILEILSN